MMRLIFDLGIIVSIIGGSFLIKHLRWTMDLNSGMKTMGYLISILMFTLFDSAQKTLIDLLLVFKPLVYSYLLIRCFESIGHPQIDLEKLLTQRELSVVKLILEGQTNKEIAAYFVVSEMTIKKHVQNILRKTKCKNRRELIELCNK